MRTSTRREYYPTQERLIYKPPGGRTEREVAAEVIVRLLETGVLAAKPADLKRACVAAGVPVGLVKQVWSTNRMVKVPIDDTPVKVKPDLTLARNPHNAYNRASKAKALFAVKVKKTGQLKSACKPCNRKYQQSRYLSSEHLKRLGPVLRFILDDNDEHAGMMCPDCSEPCRPGDEVLASDAVLRHAFHS